jgi:type VI secretion system secreted protein VgrG
MSDPALRDEFQFAWEGASHPAGPWRHLRVLEFRGQECLSRPFWFSIDLLRDPLGPDVDAADLVGSRAALKLFTRTEPSHRIVHGVIASAEELEMRGEAEWSRHRVILRPAFQRAAMMRKSYVYLEKTLRQIVEQVLQRTSLGAGLVASGAARPLGVSAGFDDYVTPKLTFAWALADTRRIDDPSARPYCVQYDESDFDFVSRLLEEEGIAYHFEHGDDESILVLADYDGGRSDHAALPVGPNVAGREIFDFSDGGRLRPRSVHLDDYNWRNPNLDLRAISPAGVTDFTDIRHPGRYEETEQHGKILAEKREQALDAERAHAKASGHCRLLGAGSLVEIEHPVAKFGGKYLVTTVHHFGSQRDWAGSGEAPEPYRQDLGFVRCGTRESEGESSFRPARTTRLPKIYGTQTATVTADPSDPGAEIHVGGPSDLGCVRLRFRWDMDDARCAEEPSSCWVRVSQFFAGADHGALWHPRVGDEVIVEYLDGDPDRPIVTGRVYNGVRPAPENATQRPTYSAIKSNTSPYNGNYNLIAFEDLQGSEEIIIHAARDYNTNVERNCSRGVGVNETVVIQGDQSITIIGSQTVKIGVDQSINIGANMTCTIAANMSCNVGGHVTITSGAIISLSAAAMGILTAPTVVVNGILTTVNGDAILILQGGALARLAAGGTVAIAGGGMVTVDGPTIKIKGGTVSISGGTVNVSGEGSVNVDGGSVNIKGGSVNLNC